MQNTNDSNLLIGVLALQMGLLSRDQMVSVFRDWINDKSTSVDQMLVASKAIDEDTRGQIMALVEKQLLANNGDVAEALSTLDSVEDSLIKEIGSLDNSLFESSLSLVGSAEARQTRTVDTFVLPAPVRNRLVSDRFMVLRPHAKGGLGKVSVALDRQLNREVALKEILEEQADSQGSRDRFILEAEITGGLEHPGIIPVYGLGTYANGQPYYAMRFIRGVSLKDATQQWHKNKKQDFQSLEFRRLVRRLIEVCNALEYAHSRGVLHRDLKPSNIMLGKFGETMVVDWGLAKAIGRSESSIGMDEPTLRPSSGSGAAETMMGQTVGTPAFMSPEQAAGQIDKLQPASDVYSLGATLFYMLTATSIGKGKNVPQILKAVAAGQIPNPVEINNRVPKPLDAICRKAMARDPAERYPRAIELAEDLELWLSDEPVSVYDEPLMVRTGRALCKHRTGFITSLAVFATATFSLSVATWLISQKNIKLQAARDLASSNQVKAVDQKNRAEENLATARAIALNLLEIAENNLSAMPGKETLREEIMDRCYAMLRDIHEQDADDPQVQMEFAQVARMSGNVKRLLNRYDESRIRLQQAVELLVALAKNDMPDKTTRDYLAGTYRDIGTLEKSAGNSIAASESLDEAAEIIDELLLSSPNDLNLRRTKGTINLELVGLLVDQVKLEEALAAAVNCVNSYRPLVGGERPATLDVVVYLISVGRQVELLGRLGRPDEAVVAFDTADAVALKVSKIESGRDLQYAYGRLLLSSAKCLASYQREISRVLEQLDESIEKFDELSKDYPRTTAYQYYLGDCWRVRALVVANQDKEKNRIAKAKASFEKATEILESIAEKTEKASYFSKLAQVLADYSSFQTELADQVAAEQLIRRAIEFATKACQLEPLNLELKQRLGKYQVKLNQLFLNRDSTEETD